MRIREVRGRDVRSDDHRIGHVSDAVGTEVVLAHPHRVIAELLGEHHLFAELVEDLIRGRPLSAMQGREDRKNACTPSRREQPRHPYTSAS